MRAAAVPTLSAPCRRRQAPGQSPDRDRLDHGRVARESIRTVLIPLPARTSRGELRRLCARIHDVASVVAVEVAYDERSIRVIGDVEIDELRAAIQGGDC